MNPPRPVAPSRPARPSRAPDRTAPAPVRPFPPVSPADPVTDPPSYTFTKTDRLLFRGEFLRAQKSGRRVRADHFTLVLFDRADGGRVRLGITTTKRAGNAVRRNRLRRLVREVFRLNRGHFPPGFDCVVVAHDQCPDLSFDTARDEILGALARRARAVRSERERERDREARPATGARPSGDTHLAAPPGPSVRPPRENR